MGVSERIKAIVNYSNLSIRAFAIKCDISQPTFDKQIKGLRAVSLETIMAICYSFPEISTEWLIRGEGEMIKVDPTIKEFERINKLSNVIESLQEIIDAKNERINQLENKLNTK